MRLNRHLSKLTVKTRYIYLFALDSTNSIEMKELNVIPSPKVSASEDLECFVSWGIQ